MSACSAAILGCEGPRLTASERAFYSEAQPWGFIVFARNLQTPDQVRRLTHALRESVGRAAPILVDQEGGRVQRLGQPHWRQWLPPLEQMQKAGPDAMRLRYRIIAEELRALGIDVNCAPCCDVATPNSHAFLRNRCYGTDPEQVTKAAREVANGLLEGGVLPVLKHMPGHGRAEIDSHMSLPIVRQPLAELQDTDFVPFRHLSDMPMGMTAHIVYEAIDPDAPATTSSDVIQVLRRDVNFSGLLMTDDISMEALSGDLTDRSHGAIQAGCDVVLHCNGVLSEMEQVVAAVGPLTGRAQARAEAALAVRKPASPIDISQAEAKFEAMMSG